MTIGTPKLGLAMHFGSEIGTHRPKALVIEDDESIRFIVRKALQAEGWATFEASTVRSGLIEAGTRRPDLIVLDLGLPDGEGVNYLNDLRAWSQVPVIVLSAQDLEADIIKALDAGADDYLTKPFSVKELQARVRAAHRRWQRSTASKDPLSSSFSFGSTTVDLATRRVLRGGEEITLTPIEYRLLVLFISNVEMVLSHNQLLTAVWGPIHANDRHYLRVYITSLRKKLEEDPKHPKHLITESSFGYRLVP